MSMKLTSRACDDTWYEIQKIVVQCKMVRIQQKVEFYSNQRCDLPQHEMSNICCFEMTNNGRYNECDK